MKDRGYKDRKMKHGLAFLI